MTSLRILDANTPSTTVDAVGLVFEYMATTQAENGFALPAAINDLPPGLAAECLALPTTYAQPGALFLACVDDEAVGCVGLKHLPALESLELKRLYVRPKHRGRGIARVLMRTAHAHAARAEVRHVVLDVMPSRTHVVEFYGREGYVRTPPYQDLGWDLIAMRREVRDTDAAY